MSQDRTKVMHERIVDMLNAEWEGGAVDYEEEDRYEHGGAWSSRFRVRKDHFFITTQSMSTEEIGPHDEAHPHDPKLIDPLDDTLDCADCGFANGSNVAHQCTVGQTTVDYKP